MLIEETKKFQVSTEAEAAELIDTYKEKQSTEGYNLSKAGYVRKEIKQKGEVIGETFTVTITKKFI
jgi:hypothetical protein